MELGKEVLDKIGMLPSARIWREKLRQLTLPKKIEVNIGGTTTSFYIETSMEYNHFDDMKERDMIKTIISQLSSGDVFWDVGGGMGIYSCIIGNSMLDISVVCFEPHPGRYLRILENVSKNELNNIYCYNIALSDSVGNFKMPINYTDPNVSRSLSGTENYIESKCHIGHQIVEWGVPAPSVVKIDVEGAEYKTLKGMAELLNSIDFIIVEIHPDKIDKNPKDINKLLENRGFSVEKVSERGSQYHLLAKKL